MVMVMKNATLVFAPGSYSESYYLAQRRLRTDPSQAVIRWSRGTIVVIGQVVII